MGILYNVPDAQTWAYIAVVLLALMAFNELGRSTKWGGILLFIIVPIVLTIFVWPETCKPGNEFGTGNWFNRVKTYSCLAGVIGFMAIRYFPKLAQKKWLLCFPPLILAINILEACIRDFQCFSYGLTDGGIINHLWVMSGPWNIMNGIAGLLNILAISGWLGIFVSKDKTKDMMYPDMTWMYIIAYDLWNFAYVYNCISDHSMYSGMLLLLSCTIPAFFIKKGMWLQHRASTLGLWCIFIMTVPQFADRIAPVPTTHNPTAFFIISLIALLSNLALVIYQWRIIIKRKLNPLKDEVYKGTRKYDKIVEEYK